MARAATAHLDDRRRPVLRLLGAAAAADLAGQVVSGRELGRRAEERRRTAFPTGLAALDGLLAAGGEAAGLPRGCLVELVGRASSGRLAAALSTLALATAAGEAAAFVDLGDHLDPESLAAAGADPDRLLWVRPHKLGEALAAAEAILAGGLPLVVLDLGLPPVPGGRGAEASWLRLARAAQAHGAALLVSSPYRVSGTAAHAVVAAETAGAVRGGAAVPLFEGLGLRFTLEKLRGHRPGATAAEVVVHPESHAEGETVGDAATAVVRPFPARRNESTPTPSARRATRSRATEGDFPTTVDVTTTPCRSSPPPDGGGRSTHGAAGAPPAQPSPAAAPMPGAAGAAAGKLGAGAARRPRATAADRAPAERRPEPPSIPHRARAGSRPQPPPRPHATTADFSTTAPPPRPLPTIIPDLHASP